MVDDFERWRNFACSALKEHSKSWLVHEATDGLEAVQKARELQPDLILLDIGLPKLNGIEAARQIRDQCPKTRILFLSEQQSIDVVREALSTGAHGYVLKSDGTELLNAVEAVFQDRIFVSKTLAQLLSSRNVDLN